MTPLPIERRATAIERLGHESFDLLVVGGGITGAGVLLDAASRGLSAALVERDDLAVGTSSRSSKLIHGGLRYLEQFRFGLVREALAERRRLLRLAPHLVRLERFVVPIHGLPLLLPYVGAGMVLYDLLGAARDGGRFRTLLPGTVRRLAPMVRPKRLRGGFVYHDAIVDDARLVVAVVRTALDFGALAVTRAAAIELLGDGERAAGVRVLDRLSGRELDVRAAAVVDATGVTAGPRGPFGVVGHAEPSLDASVRPSRGIHLVVRRDRFPVATGLTLRVPGRVVFVIPWDEHVIVGTTDEPHTGPTERPAATASEIDYLLGHVNAAMDVELGRADLVATYAGIRPLAGGGDSDTVKASREHRVEAPMPGLVTVRGGKYTTYRVMARDAVDAALGQVARRRPSLSAGLPIRGAITEPEGAGLAAALAARFGLDARRAGRLVARHGSDATAVAELGAERGLLRPLADGAPYLEADVAWAAREELALGLDDVLARRTRLVLETPDQGRGAARRTAELLAAELGWDAATRALAVSAYEASSELEYGTTGR